MSGDVENLKRVNGIVCAHGWRKVRFSSVQESLIESFDVRACMHTCQVSSMFP